MYINFACPSIVYDLNVCHYDTLMIQFVYHHTLTNKFICEQRKNTFDKSSLLSNAAIHVYKFTIKTYQTPLIAHSNAPHKHWICNYEDLWVKWINISNIKCRVTFDIYKSELVISRVSSAR